MEKTYQPSQIESKWYALWEKSNYFAPSGNGEAYCIMIPPPNVTGSLHMGHGFQESIMDALIRYHRMRGFNTLWQVGTDHAGIATQMVVERLLNAEGINRQDLGREDFIKKVWEWKEHSGGTITRQLRRLGASPDWSRERFTMDEGFYKAVQEVFVRLYEDGLIYRGLRLVNWDPKLHTAISDLEVDSKEEDGHLWHFRYPLADGSGHLTVATTRPETMLGDTAVAVNPQDERYQHLVGQMIALPLTDRLIPIIADDYVDMAFGTGCVKITPAHDFNDYQVGQRHNLPLINIFDDDAKINHKAPQKYCGMDRFVARKVIIEDFETLGLLEKIQAHKLKVPRGDRSGVVIEPYLTHQWYVKTQTLADLAIEAVENESIKFVPKQYENMYFSWMRDIQDWCISRQLWWGHRIPAWYDADGKVYVARSEDEARRVHKLDSSVILKQDEDVLDTWFSSGLWTFGTLGWPEENELLKTFHPSSVLVTGFDIIFFWVARMIMLTLYFRKEIPFHTVYVHGLVRDKDGQKMSKSKGNVLDPIDLIDGIDLETLVKKRTSGLMNPKDASKIEKATRKEFPDGLAAYGTDALRFTYYSLASTGRDINFDVGRIEGFRNFCNKLWQASNYVLMNCENQDCGTSGNCELGDAERWIQTRFQLTQKAVTEGFNTYRLDLVSQALYDFIWKDFCDWYLELTKAVFWGENISAERKTGTRRTLLRTLESTLRLAHPLMPFISEEIWQRIKSLAGAQGESIMLAPYPEFDASVLDDNASTAIEWLKNIIVGLRNIRGEMNIPPSKQLSVLVKNAKTYDLQQIEKQLEAMKKLANLDSIRILSENENAPLSATALAGNMEILVPMAGLIDKQVELTRLAKEKDRLESEVLRLESKLSNANFVDRAPTEVVEVERQKLKDAQAALHKISAQALEISSL